MPQKKRQQKKDDSSSDTSLNSSGDEGKKPAKKQKTEKEGKSSKDDGGEKNWDLGSRKSVRISEFRGRMFIDIREYYMDKNSGDMKPGKKGIALNAEQWQKLKSIIPEVDEALKNS